MALCKAHSKPLAVSCLLAFTQESSAPVFRAWVERVKPIGKAVVAAILRH